MPDTAKKKSDKKQSNSLIEQLLSTSVCALILGKHVGVSVKGTQNEISAVSNALLASRNLQEELNRPDTTVESVMEKLRLKRECAREFERVMGIHWPL